MDRHCLRSAIAAAAFAVSAVLVAPVASAAPFDGPWSVTVITRSGPCDSSYRYGVMISGGRVGYLGGGGVAVSGRVSPSGAVSVSVERDGCVPTEAAAPGAAAARAAPARACGAPAAGDG